MGQGDLRDFMAGSLVAENFVWLRKSPTPGIFLVRNFGNRVYTKYLP